jgi:hypothetical protein
MKTLLLLIPVAALCGCAGMGDGPQSSYDRFAGVTINSTRGNDLPIGFLENYSIILDMRQEINSAAKTNYFFVAGSNSLYVKLVPAFGESLFLLADGRRFSFSTDLRLQSGVLGNRYFYPADASSLRAIGLATNVEVRIVEIGGGKIEKTLSAKKSPELPGFRNEVLAPCVAVTARNYPSGAPRVGCAQRRAVA